jgi:hypothetical protein
LGIAGIVRLLTAVEHGGQTSLAQASEKTINQGLSRCFHGRYFV